MVGLEFQVHLYRLLHLMPNFMLQLGALKLNSTAVIVSFRSVVFWNNFEISVSVKRNRVVSAPVLLKCCFKIQLLLINAPLKTNISTEK